MAGFVQTQERPPKREEHGEHLLPGIPDDLTLYHIVTKLPWRTLHILPSLCRGWQVAIRRRQVYDARVFQNATETLVLHSREKGIVQASFLALYSVRDKSSYFLPLIPNVELGIPIYCQYIALEGKIYVLGGVHSRGKRVSEKVYVLDLLGRRQWKQCASMREPPRQRFGCGVVDGKIYVIGNFEDEHCLWSEVYDPKKDAWSSIMSISSSHSSGNAVTLGEELIVNSQVHRSTHSHVYHPVKNEWRRLEHFKRVAHSEVYLVVAGGKLYAVRLRSYPDRLKIYVYDMDNDSWMYLHWSLLFNYFGTAAISFHGVQALDDELFALVFVRSRNEESNTWEKYFLHSEGLGGENKQIAWEKVDLPRDWQLVPSLTRSVKL